MFSASFEHLKHGLLTLCVSLVFSPPLISFCSASKIPTSFRATRRLVCFLLLQQVTFYGKQFYLFSSPRRKSHLPDIEANILPLVLLLPQHIVFLCHTFSVLVPVETVPCSLSECMTVQQVAHVGILEAEQWEVDFCICLTVCLHAHLLASDPPSPLP